MAKLDRLTIARAAAHPGIAALISAGADPAWPPLLLVGGGARDIALGREAHDIDVMVEGPLDEVLAAVDDVQRHHSRFETATITIAGEEIDLARSRRESYPQPGALPVVEPAESVEDLQRRDFTVNAIALRLTGAFAGSLLAVADAPDDLESGRLRVLHAESFRDDPTRMLRLARYRARLGFTVERETAELLGAALAGGSLATVTGTRIGNELRLLAAERDPIAAFLALGELGIAEALEPGFGVGDRALAAAAVSLLPDDGRADLLIQAIALLGVADARREGLLRRLATTAGDAARILSAVRDIDRDVRLLVESRRPSELLDGFRDATPERVALAGAFGPQRAAETWLEDLRHRRLAIGGADLIAAGVPQSAALLRGLQAAEAALLDGDAPGREEQLAIALRAAAGND